MLVKSIADPLKISFMGNPHFPNYFEGHYSINENGKIVLGPHNKPVTAEKIAVNHYHYMSREEYAKRAVRGEADHMDGSKYAKRYDGHDYNEIFDNEILKYRAARAEVFSLEPDAEKVRRVTKALTATLSKFANDELSDLETALTCRAVSNFLGLKVHEEASLAAILKSLDNVTVADAQLFISELPKLLRLPYPGIDELRGVSLQIIEHLKDFTRINNNWFYYVELDYIRDFLEE